MIENFARALVLAPHTDDGELGCGGTIARLREAGSRVVYAAFSTAKQSLPPGLPGDTLKKEVAAATSRLGIPEEDLRIYDYQVRKLNYSRQDVLEDLMAIRRDYAPELVFMPSLHDIHQDHSTVAAEALRAFKGVTLLGYELIWNNLTFNTDCFVRLSREHLERKVRAFAEYKSQAGRPYASRDFLEALARTRGVQIGCEFAECFEVVRWVV